MSTTINRTDQRRQAAIDFVEAIITLCEADKGAQAALRSGLGRPVEQCGRLHRYLVPRTRDGMFPAEERAYYAVAALIAGRPREARDADAARRAATAETPEPAQSAGDSPEAAVEFARQWASRPNLGTSLGQVVRAGKLKEESAESHLHLLTRQSAASVHLRLPALTSQILSARIEIDFAVLLADLARWEIDRDRIAKRWLQSFYRTLHAPKSSDQPADPSDDENENA